MSPARLQFFKIVNSGLIPAMKAKNFAKLAEGFKGPSYR